jgi:hypothetical protein
MQNFKIISRDLFLILSTIAIFFCNDKFQVESYYAIDISTKNKWIIETTVPVTYKEASNYAEKLRQSTGLEWTIPTENELIHLYNILGESMLYNSNMGKDRRIAPFIWNSSSFWCFDRGIINDDLKHRYVSMYNGNKYWNEKSTEKKGAIYILPNISSIEIVNCNLCEGSGKMKEPNIKKNKLKCPQCNCKGSFWGIVTYKKEKDYKDFFGKWKYNYDKVYGNIACPTCYGDCIDNEVEYSKNRCLLCNGRGLLQKRTFLLPPMSCTKCNGRGWQTISTSYRDIVFTDKWVECGKCDWTHSVEYGNSGHVKDCPKCAGEGGFYEKIINNMKARSKKVCDRCRGTGTL